MLYYGIGLIENFDGCLETANTYDEIVEIAKKRYDKEDNEYYQIYLFNEAKGEWTIECVYDLTGELIDGVKDVYIY